MASAKNQTLTISNVLVLTFYQIGGEDRFSVQRPKGEGTEDITDKFTLSKFDDPETGHPGLILTQTGDLP